MSIAPLNIGDKNMLNKFLTIETDSIGEKTVIELNPDRIPSLSPDILRLRLDGKALSAKRCIIQGKAPLWFYTHIAVKAFLAGAEQIDLFQPDCGLTCIYPLAPGPNQNSQWFERKEIKPGVVLCTVNPDGLRFSPSNPSDSPIRFQNCRQLILTNSGANWMYAALGVAAAAGGVETILLDLPTIDSCYVPVGENNLDKRYPKPVGTCGGIIVGVAGDPNSGKSILSFILATLLKGRGLKSWCYDCDAASPTPNWYTNMVAEDRNEDAKALRDPCKRPWTHEMECSVAEKLRNTRRELEITLADLPGGNHSISPPERIPDGREVIIKEIDRFILLGRKDDPGIREKWRGELDRLGLQNHIIAEIDSTAPENELSAVLFCRNGLIHGDVTGLNRKAKSSVEYPEIAKKLQEQLDPLLSCITRSFSSHD